MPRFATLLLLIASAFAASAVDFHVTVDLRDAQGKPFAEPARLLCEEWYPKIDVILFGPGHPLPYKELKLIFERSIVQGDTIVPSYSDRDTIHINSKYVAELHKQLPNDYRGMLIHELTHVVQQYPETPDAGWLIEGIADYVRHKYFERDIKPRLQLDADGNPTGFELDRNKGQFATQGYLGGYTVAGAFLYWLEVRKDREIVPTLNRALQQGRYSPELFVDRCGAPLDTLWRNFVAQSRS